MPAYELAINVGATDNASAVIDQVTSKLGGLGKFAAGIGGAAVGALALVGTAAAGATALAFGTAQDIQSGQRDIQRSLGDTANTATDYKAVMTDAFGANLGDDMADIAQTIIEVEQNTARLGGVSESVLSGMVQDAELLQRTFGTDTKESIGAATALMDNFGLTGAEAFDFIAKGQQRGLDSSGDLLDTIEEYSPQFRAAGADAGQFFSLMETGIGSGTFLGTDRVADAFGEFRKRILDDSKLTKESLDSLGFNSDQFLGDIASGAVPVTDAFEMVTKALVETDDLVVQNVAGVGLLGTQFEDLGVDAIRGLDLSKTSLEDMTGATDSLSSGFRTLGEVGQGAWRQLGLALAPFGESILEIVNDNIPLLETGVTRVAEKVGSLAVRLAEATVAAVETFDAGAAAGGGSAIAGAAALTGAAVSFDPATQVTALDWGDFVTTLDWDDKVFTLEWDDRVVTIDWDDKVVTLDWGDYVTELDWSGQVFTLDWGDFLFEYDWGNSVERLEWGNFLKVYDFENAVDTIVWGDFVSVLDWNNKIATVEWGDFMIQVDWDRWIVDINWGDWMATFSWDTYVSSLNWGDWISDILWASFVPAITWGSFIASLSWSSFVPNLSWSSFVSGISWSSFVPSLSWSSFISGVSLASYIPSFPGWSAFIRTVSVALPGNASGTESFRGGLSLVGERGPEIVQMPTGSRVLNASRTRELRREAGGGHGPITIVINESSTPRETASAVQSVLQRARAKGIR